MPGRFQGQNPLAMAALKKKKEAEAKKRPGVLDRYQVQQRPSSLPPPKSLERPRSALKIPGSFRNWSKSTKSLASPVSSAIDSPATSTLPTSSDTSSVNGGVSPKPTRQGANPNAPLTPCGFRANAPASVTTSPATSSTAPPMPKPADPTTESTTGSAIVDEGEGDDCKGTLLAKGEASSHSPESDEAAEGETVAGPKEHAATLPSTEQPSATPAASAEPAGRAVEQPVWTYEQLQEVLRTKEYGDLEPTAIESYLSSKEFRIVFKMPKPEFYELKKWRQMTLKQRLKLW